MLLFFIANVPLNILIFLCGKLLCKIRYKFKIFNSFKIYDFNFYLLLMILDGNFQFINYYLASDIRNLFYFNILTKSLDILLIIIYFIVIVITLGGIFIAKWHYQNSIFINLNKNKFKKCLYFFFISGIYNFLLGIIHSVTYKSSNQLIYISCI
jgi:hypothetical protein